MYATAGATSAEMVEIVSELGPAEVSPSKMCISLLRAQQVPAEFLGTGRRSSYQGGGLTQMEAVQIAGPFGVFEEWKVSAWLVGLLVGVVAQFGWFVCPFRLVVRFKLWFRVGYIEGVASVFVNSSARQVLVKRAACCCVLLFRASAWALEYFALPFFLSPEYFFGGTGWRR